MTPKESLKYMRNIYLAYTYLDTYICSIKFTLDVKYFHTLNSVLVNFKVSSRKCLSMNDVSKMGDFSYFVVFLEIYQLKCPVLIYMYGHIYLVSDRNEIITDLLYILHRTNIETDTGLLFVLSVLDWITIIFIFWIFSNSLSLL